MKRCEYGDPCQDEDVKRVDLEVTYGHDGEPYFRAAGTLNWLDPARLLNLYPSGSKLHVEIERDRDSPYDWACNERAWIEIP